MNFIAGYVTDSDDEDDLVKDDKKRKSTTDKHHDDNEIKKLKTENGPDIKQRLPAPTGIQSMFVSPPMHEDDPDEHDGRIRTFEHERGNWASYVYAPVSHHNTEHLEGLTCHVIEELHSIAEFFPSMTFHLSLSRMFIARHHWIQPLLKSLQNRLNTCRSTSLAYCGLKWYSNDEKTRTFIAIEVGTGSPVLKSYIQAIDSALEEFKLPTYYEDPSFHISLAWTTGDVTDKLTDAATSQLQTHTEEYCELLGDLDISELRFKTGNKTFSLSLPGN